MKTLIILVVLAIVQIEYAHANAAPSQKPMPAEIEKDLDIPVHSVVLIDRSKDSFDMKFSQLTPNELSCERRQLAAYKEAASAFSGGAFKVFEALNSKYDGVVDIFVVNYGISPRKEKSVKLSKSIHRTNLEIEANLYVDPKTHIVTCDIVSSDEIIKTLSDKSLGLRQENEKAPGKSNAVK